MFRKALTISAILASLVFAAPAIATSPRPNEGGGGGGGGQVCTWGAWVGAGQYYAPCGYNNWRSGRHSAAYSYGACWTRFYFEYEGTSDSRCGDVSNLPVYSNGTYQRPIISNLVNFPVYYTGYVSTSP